MAQSPFQSVSRGEFAFIILVLMSRHLQPEATCTWHDRREPDTSAPLGLSSITTLSLKRDTCVSLREAGTRLQHLVLRTQDALKGTVTPKYVCFLSNVIDRDGAWLAQSSTKTIGNKITLFFVPENMTTEDNP